MVFKSKFAGFRVKVRSEASVVHPSTGVVVNKIPGLVCEFGTFGQEYQFEDQDGNISTAADIIGHYFDTDAAAERLKWTDDEKETVEQVLLNWCQQWPEAIWLHSEAPAPKPWPKYDETHHNQVATLAAQLGLLVEALAYEKQNAKRPSVIEKLTDALEQAQAAEVADESLTAA